MQMVDLFPYIDVHRLNRTVKSIVPENQLSILLRRKASGNKIVSAVHPTKFLRFDIVMHLKLFHNRIGSRIHNSKIFVPPNRSQQRPIIIPF